MADDPKDEKPRPPDEYPEGSVVSFPLGSPEHKAWIERQRQLDEEGEEDDDISDLDELEELLGPVEEPEDNISDLDDNNAKGNRTE